MTWAAEVQAEVARAVADLSGSGLTGEGDATNAVLSRKTAGVYDATAGSVATTTTTWDCIAVLEDVSPDGQDGTMQHAPLKRAILAPGDFTPQENDTLAVGGVTYTVMGVRGPQVGGATAGWLLDLRV
jgi:hypothetical protein